jgi:3-oxoacyl-[acyl-carrier protein] reductase
MDLGLRGAAALVIGGSYGIGAAIARTLAQEGASVTVVARDERRLRQAVAELQHSTGQTVRSIAGDATSAADVERAVAAATIDGMLDIAIMAAGASRRATLVELTDADWVASFDLNLLSAVRLARAAAPLLRASHGSLTFLAAASGKQPTPGQIASNVSKAALINLTRSLAEELAPDVRVNAVCPGRVLTPQWERKAAVEGPAEGLTPEAYLQRVAQTTALKRMGQPEEIAALAVFLASRRASYITGQSVSADGGLVKAII